MKEKTARIQANKDRRPRATAKYIRMSSTKANLVLGLIRGKDYNEAVVWYKKAAEAGDAGGYWGLARCCYYYDSPFRDYTSCMYYCNRGNEISGLMMDYSIYF